MSQDSVGMQMQALQQRVMKGERGLLGCIGRILFYGQDGKTLGGSGRLAAYLVSTKDLGSSLARAREEMLKIIPREVIEIAAYVEVLPPPIPEEPETMENFSRQLARKRGEHGDALLVKNRDGMAPLWVNRGTKTHQELAADRASLR